jgi:hypothetical protein
MKNCIICNKNTKGGYTIPLTYEKNFHKEYVPICQECKKMVKGAFFQYKNGFLHIKPIYNEEYDPQKIAERCIQCTYAPLMGSEICLYCHQFKKVTKILRR